MQIGIDLDNYESPMEEAKNLVSSYGFDREIGFLKLNPERLPVIVSERKALEDIARYGEHKMDFTVKDGHYFLITDERAMTMRDGNIILFGNAYIVKRQGQVFTALNMKEIKEWLYYICGVDENEDPKPIDKLEFSSLVFELDSKLGYWR